MVKHNNLIPNSHFKKHWQNYVNDQPARKTRRRIARKKKAVKIFPRPTAGPLRPVVQCQTLKYKIKKRAGRGFTLEELKFWSNKSPLWSNGDSPTNLMPLESPSPPLQLSIILKSAVIGTDSIMHIYELRIKSSQQFLKSMNLFCDQLKCLRRRLKSKLLVNSSSHLDVK